MQYIVHYDVAAMIILITIMLHFENKRTIHTRFTKFLKILLSIAFLSAVLDLVTSFTISYADYCPIWLNYVLNQALHISFMTSTMVYCAYIINLTKNQRIIKWTDRLLIFLPICTGIVFILTTGITKLAFYFDEAGQYHRGPFIWFIYGISAFYTFIAMLYTWYNKSQITKTQKKIVFIFSIGSMLAILIQILYAELMIVHFMMSVVCLLIYLSLENPEDYTEKRYGTFNYIAFVEIMKEYFNKNEKFQVLGLQMEGMQNIKDAMGVAYADIVLKEVAEYLMKAAGKDKVYYISENRFGILDQKKKEEWDKLIADIRERFDIPFYINKLQLSLSAGMAMIAYPNNAKQLEEAIDILSFSLNKAVDGNSKEVIYNQKECLAEARRESKLLQIMRDALKNNSFMVYYQPIYSVKEQRYTSAEALIRLIDPELGFISPDEFITLAERRGLILEIGEFVFRQVCLFIKENRIWEKGIHCIDVNLSAVQCMQEYLHQQLIGIMNEYEMDYRYIHLEVTETAAVNSGEALQNNMKQLMSYGVKFSLDDYGTGYSNLSNLIKFPFYTIKLDKSMVWSAMESEKAMCALKHTISMIKEMNNVIVAEGVETKEQALMLTEMGCDYFQGYYYSKPVNKEEFLKIVS